MLHPHPGHLEVLVEVLAPMLAVQVHFSLCTAMRGSSDTHTHTLSLSHQPPAIPRDLSAVLSPARCTP